MNILVINYEYPPVGGGGGVAAANLAEALVTLGHSVDYVTSRCGDLAAEETIRGVRVFREQVIGRKHLHTASIISMLSYPHVAIRRGLKLAQEKKYDVVHTHFAIPSGPAGCVLSRKLKIPHVLSVIGGDIYDPSKSYSPHRHPVMKRVVSRVLAASDVIVGESKDICGRTSEIFNPKASIERIPLGYLPVDFSRVKRAELGLKDSVQYGIAVSRLIPRKDYATLLRAFSKADVSGLELLVVGDGPEEPAMRALCADLGIGDRVHFLGPHFGGKKYQYLEVCDFFALSPLHEGYGIVYQEAMYMGLPIVTTNVGGQTDFLREGENALLTAPGDVDGMAASIRRISGDADLRRKMRETNLQDIKPQMIENVARKYEELFKSISAKSITPLSV